MATREAQLVRVDEIARRLNTSTDSVYRLAKRQENPLPAVRLTPKTIRFSWSQVARWAGITDEGES